MANMVESMRNLLSLRLAFLVAITSVCIGLVGLGCKIGTSNLEQGGAYSPGSFIVTPDPSGTGTVTNFVATGIADKSFFVVDSSYDLAFSVVDAVFNFERNNRLALWKLSPQIKGSLDAIRPKAVDINLRYAKARQAYMLNPAPSGLTPLQTILAELQNLASAAQAAITPAQNP